MKLLTALCFWISAKKDTANNIKKFGVDYEEYMRKVPMWNVLEGLRRKF
jgi:protein-S-isoprenylcysteine O-methyltransferase Ste14